LNENEKISENPENGFKTYFKTFDFVRALIMNTNQILFGTVSFAAITE